MLCQILVNWVNLFLKVHYIFTSTYTYKVPNEKVVLSLNIVLLQ